MGREPVSHGSQGWPQDPLIHPEWLLSPHICTGAFVSDILKRPPGLWPLHSVLEVIERVNWAPLFTSFERQANSVMITPLCQVISCPNLTTICDTKIQVSLLTFSCPPLGPIPPWAEERMTSEWQVSLSVSPGKQQVRVAGLTAPHWLLPRGRVHLQGVGKNLARLFVLLHWAFSFTGIYFKRYGISSLKSREDSLRHSWRRQRSRAVCTKPT